MGLGRRKIYYGLGAVILAALAAVGIWMVNGKMEVSETNGAPYAGYGGTFKNTLVGMDTPDPSVVYKDGFYYMTFTHNGADVMVMKSRTLDFKHAEKKVVWYPPVDTAYSSALWAPEIQYLRGKWYIYFAADDGANENHRMYALEADTDDPMGDYTFKGQISDESNRWAIDGLVLELEEKLYFVWSGWEGDVNIAQNTYIAPMSDPLTISGPRVLLSAPDLDWERAGGPPYINEGQSILKKDGRVFLVYSGAGSWTPHYSLGMLALKQGGDPLNPADWEKSALPLMAMDDEAGVYGPGHNSFVKSPDGSEDWIVYHATSGITDGWNNRKARAQRVEWGEDGLPSFGSPLSLDTAIPVPSGSGVFLAVHAEKTDGGGLRFGSLPLGTGASRQAPLLLHYRNASGAEVTVSLEAPGGEPIDVKLPPLAEGETGYAYAVVDFAEGSDSVVVSSNGANGETTAGVNVGDSGGSASVETSDGVEVGTSGGGVSGMVSGGVEVGTLSAIASVETSDGVEAGTSGGGVNGEMTGGVEVGTSGGGVSGMVSGGVEIVALEIPRYEAEYAQGSGGMIAEDNPFSSGTGVMRGEEGGAIAFSSVIVPAAGTYTLRIAASNSSDAETAMVVEAPGGKKSVKLPPSARSEFPVTEVKLTLRKGVNSITLKPATENVAVDYIDVIR